MFYHHTQGKKKKKNQTKKKKKKKKKKKDNNNNKDHKKNTKVIQTFLSSGISCDSSDSIRHRTLKRASAIIMLQVF